VKQHIFIGKGITASSVEVPAHFVNRACLALLGDEGSLITFLKVNREDSTNL
jgi:hypothetical protein